MEKINSLSEIPAYYADELSQVVKGREQVFKDVALSEGLEYPFFRNLVNLPQKLIDRIRGRQQFRRAAALVYLSEGCHLPNDDTSEGKIHLRSIRSNLVAGLPTLEQMELLRQVGLKIGSEIKNKVWAKDVVLFGEFSTVGNNFTLIHTMDGEIGGRRVEILTEAGKPMALAFMRRLAEDDLVETLSSSLLRSTAVIQESRVK